MKITSKAEYRMYEMLTGILVWGSLVGAIIASFVAPMWAIVFIIIFDIYWLLKVVYFTINIIIAWKAYKRTNQIQWQEKMCALPQWKRYTHMVVLPTYKEGVDVVRHTLSTLTQSSYPMKRVVVVLAGEEKDRENFIAIAGKMREEFGMKFKDILVTVHPMNKEGELPGKGSNLHSVGPKLKAYADENNIAYKDCIISAFDVDTIAHQEYFSYLTYTYATHPNPTRSSYQPIPTYNNNMWEVPAIVRIMAFGTTFWLMSEITRPHRMWTFSSHSMSLQALVDCGYWQNNIVSEDSRIFLQMFIRYDGEYEVTPLFLPVSMDTVTGPTVWQSIKNVYKQQRRWAWGVENLPFMLWHFKRNSRIPRRKKFRLVGNYLEGMYSWSLAALLILILGRLPLWVGKQEYADSILFQNAPFVLEHLMAWAMLGLFISAGLSFTLLPKPQPHTTWLSYVSTGLHWLTLPITLIVLGSFPAIDAQTRMLFGKYLGFNVTKKQRTKSQENFHQSTHAQHSQT